jgi:hypothetical protein
MTVELLHLPGCPHLDATRQLVFDCLDALGLPRTAVVEQSGPFPSPSILVNGADVMGVPDVLGAACRLDVPTRERLLIALRPLVTNGGRTAS